jgi:hypothetical protein
MRKLFSIVFALFALLGSLVAYLIFLQKHWDQANMKLLGVYFLGTFVGFLLVGAAFASKKVSIKAAITLIGAALGGAPILFMRDLSFEKWMYPIGLVTGMMWIRVVKGRKPLLRNLIETDPFYLIDMVAIAAFTAIVVVCATFVRTK